LYTTYDTRTAAAALIADRTVHDVRTKLSKSSERKKISLFHP